MKQFDKRAAVRYFETLEKIASQPLPDDLLASCIQKNIAAFCNNGNKSPVAVWNFYKQTLDDIVYCAGARRGLLTLFDLEPYFSAPVGGFNQKDGSIKNAPWRNQQ